MDIMGAIAAATKSLEALKAIREVEKSFDDATWKAQVADLMSAMADVKITLIDANQKIHDLELENKQLHNRQKFLAENTIKQKGFTYEKFDDGTVSRLPFCQNCMAEGKYIKIMESPIGGGCACPSCKNHFQLRTLVYAPAA